MRPFPLMLFAAGLGTRMGGLTADRPKPLIPVAGKALIDHALDLTTSPAVGSKVVNLHYLGQQIADHLRGQNVALSWENDRILDTGGGLRQALPLLGAGPVMTLNTDAVWLGPNPLDLLAQAWDGAEMDALLMVTPPDRAHGTHSRGDFLRDADGRITRARGADGVIYLGAQILRTDLLADISDPVFSLNVLWDRLIATRRAYAITYPGQWCDVGHPAGIALAERVLSKGEP